jgi:hypothetical protein
MICIYVGFLGFFVHSLIGSCEWDVTDVWKA